MKLKKRAARGKKAKAKRNRKKHQREAPATREDQSSEVEEEEEVEEVSEQLEKPDEIKEKKVSKENEKNGENKAGEKCGASNEKSGKKPSPPPIKVNDESSVLKIFSLLSNNKQIDDKYYLMMGNRGKGSTISTLDLETFEIVKQILIDNGIKHFTFTPKVQQRQTFVLKGVWTHCFTTDEIKKKIEEAAPKLQVLKVTTMKYQWNDKISSHFLVQISSNSNEKELTSIAKIGKCSARWERLKKKQLFQCKNCQRMGHAAGNCRLPYRCVKCAENHKPGECSLRGPQPRDKLKCANCMGTGHPASWRGCPLLQNARQLLKLLNERVKLQKLLSDSDFFESDSFESDSFDSDSIDLNQF